MSRRTKKEAEEEEFPASLEKFSASRRAWIERILVDVAEALQIVCRKIFGDDWIEALSAQDDKLIRHYYGPEMEWLLSEQALRIGSVKPVPAALRNKVDRALGRCLRMNAQRITAAEWLKRHGPPARFGSYDRNALLKALADIDRPVVTPAAGKRAVVEPQVENAIRADLDSDKLTKVKLTGMTLKEIGEQYRCGKDTARKVKNRILQHSQK